MNFSDFGLIGLAVMGENLVLNLERNGFKVAVYNRTTDKVDDFVKGRAKGKQIRGCYTLEELVASLSRPRKVMLLVKAGRAVDQLIEQLLPLLEPGDIIIDGGNSHFPDSIRRTTMWNPKDNSTSAPAYRAGKKVRCWALPSCPAVHLLPGNM